MPSFAQKKPTGRKKHIAINKQHCTDDDKSKNC